jgi:quinol-cytochrome oxidoreductase complex cytochrome b subunit
MNRRLPYLTLLVFILVGFLGIKPTAQASPAFLVTPTIQPAATFDTVRLEKPETEQQSTQLDEGALYYWGVCMACHGDRGQGLTEEWRLSYEEQERGCRESGCHGQDYPGNSFEIPETGIPAIAGSGKLTRFTNTREMYDYVFDYMPWGRSGSLTPDTVWALSAYLMKLHGNELVGLKLNKTNGSAIPIHRQLNLPTGEGPGVAFLAGLLILGVLSMLAPGYLKMTAGAGSLSRPSFFHHLHPPSIPSDQARWRYTLGAGGLAIFLSLVLLGTGLLEMFYYIPTTEQAAASIQIINALVPFGNLIRNLHFWSAQVLVVVMSIHLLRVILTGAYKPPRRLNYLIGLGLLVCILLLNFSGYVLRWDEGIRWALVVGTNLLKTIPWIGGAAYRILVGGNEPGTGTLIRFFTWHIFSLTLVAAYLSVWHAFRVRRDGGIAAPPPLDRSKTNRISRFVLVRREVFAVLIASIVLLFIASVLNAPIDQPITPDSLDRSTSRAPWFFLWVQELIKWGDPFLLGVLVPTLVLIALGLFPFLLPVVQDSESGRWFPRGNRIAQVSAILIFLAIVALTILGAVD